MQPGVDLRRRQRRPPYLQPLEDAVAEPGEAGDGQDQPEERDGVHGGRLKTPAPAPQGALAASRRRRYGPASNQATGTTMEEILEDEAREQYRVTAGELRQFVERYERLEAERRDLSDQMKEVLAEARARGYDIKVLKKLIALRKRDSSEVSEEEAILELYKQALGM
jgi:uncharacterized protein (UPF0335 family)